jgi:hypothetical protein
MKKVCGLDRDLVYSRAFTDGGKRSLFEICLTLSLKEGSKAKQGVVKVEGKKERAIQGADYEDARRL